MSLGLGNLKESELVKVLGLDGVILEFDLKVKDGMVWSTLIWLRIGINGEVL
jgi:hypothetical protein